MTTLLIKLIAIITMVIDHIGIFFFPHLIILRIIGRLSFPLFAWLIANGAHHSKNRRNYLMRILILGLISQIPYFALFQMVEPGIMQLNIMFTLSLGLGVIILAQKYQRPLAQLLIIAFFSFISIIARVEYGVAGVLSIYFFFRYYKDFKKMFLSQLGIMVVFYTLPLSIFILTHTSKTVFINTLHLIQPFSLISLLMIRNYNDKKGIQTKIFYIFYPLHLVGIYLLRLIS